MRSGISTGVFRCVAMVLAVSAPARADPAAEARFHDELARDHYAHARYEAAIREFFLEQRVAPNPRTAFNVALCFQQLHRAEDAFLLFNEYLASKDDDAERRSTAAQAVAAIEKKIARVEVVSDPPGARIFVDREEHGDYGVTPRVIAVSPGAHHVWTELEGYRGGNATVEAKIGEKARVDLPLPRIVGNLTVSSAAPGIVEVLDANGRTVASGQAPLEAPLPPGTYEVHVNASGFAPWKGIATVKPNAKADVRAEPERLAEPTGDITVTANVSGALIKLDAHPVGFSPAVIAPVGAGTHRLQITAPGLVPWSGPVNVRPDERAWVTVGLEPPIVKTRSPATWVVGGVGLAALAASGVVALFARKAHSDFESAPPDDQSLLRDRGQTLNTAADVLLVSGLVATGAGLALYFLTEQSQGRPSSATVARGAR